METIKPEMFILITLKNDKSTHINIKLRDNFDIEYTYLTVPGISIT